MAKNEYGDELIALRCGNVYLELVPVDGGARAEHDGQAVDVRMIGEDGHYVAAPYVIRFKVNPETGKIIFWRHGGVNEAYVEVESRGKGSYTYNYIREAKAGER